MEKKKPKKKHDGTLGGSMLVGVSKTKPGMGGTSKKSAMKMIKKKKAMY